MTAYLTMTRAEGVLSDDTYLGWILSPGRYALVTSITNNKDMLPIGYSAVDFFELKPENYFIFLTDANGNISTVSYRKAIKDINNGKELSDEYVQDLPNIKTLTEAPDTTPTSLVVGVYIGRFIGQTLGYVIASPFYVLYGIGWVVVKAIEIRYGVKLSSNNNNNLNTRYSRGLTPNIYLTNLYDNQSR